MLFSKIRSCIFKINPMSLILNSFLHIYVSMLSSDKEHGESSAPEHSPQSHLFYTNVHLYSVGRTYYY